MTDKTQARWGQLILKARKRRVRRQAARLSERLIEEAYGLESALVWASHYDAWKRGED